MRVLGNLSPTRAFLGYSLFTYAVSWSVWTVWTTVSVPVLLDTALFVLGASGSFLVALLFVRAEGRDVRTWLGSVLRVRVGGRYYAFAIRLPFGIVLVAAVAHVLVFGGR